MAYQLINPQWAQGRRIQGVLFDMDGVILDSEKLYSQFWQEALQALGYPMTREQAIQMRSLNRDAGAAKLQSFFGPEVDYAAARNKRIELMDLFVRTHGIEPLPGVYDLLDVLDTLGIPAAITTSSPPERVREYLEPLSLFHRFQAICTVYQVAKGKPEPDIYLFGAESLGLRPEACIAIEDSDTGILSACRAGCLPVMVPDQDVPAASTLPRLYALADSLSDIPPILQSVNG